MWFQIYKWHTPVVVEISKVENAIKCLDINKTDGMDGVYAEHLKHCDKRIVPLLAMCITGFFVHGFLPSSLLSVVSVVLVPIIKDKCSKINSKDNYRPIALASIVKKNWKHIVRQNVSYAVNNVQSVWIWEKTQDRLVYLCLKGSYWQA